ncbi:MAG: NfeD family protein [Euryarchaeota archaeon]|nr:NfeD family protein [Euryarchaeota archaeon]
MAERWKLLVLLIDEMVLIAVYFIIRFPIVYFIILLSVMMVKDAIVIHKAWEIMGRRNLLGMENLINREGIVIKKINPIGQIKIGNEIWGAESDALIEEGEKVTVIGFEGLSVEVEKYKGDCNGK